MLIVNYGQRLNYYKIKDYADSNIRTKVELLKNNSKVNYLRE